MSVYSLVLIGPSPFLQQDNVYAKQTYSQIIDVRLKAIQISRQECQTKHCQYISKNISVQFKTEKLALVKILPDICGIGYHGRCL